MTVVGRSKTGIYIQKGDRLMLVYLEHSADQIANDFFALPKFATVDEAEEAFPHLKFY